MEYVTHDSYSRVDMQVINENVDDDSDDFNVYVSAVRSYSKFNCVK